MGIDTAKLQRELIEWVMGHEALGIAATLTFRPRLEGRRLRTEDAQSAVKTYLRRLSAIAYGKGGIRKGKRVVVVAAREGSDDALDKHLHYHLQIWVPEGWTFSAWLAVCAAEWTKLDWASPKQNVFKLTWSHDWIKYILKIQDKRDYMYAMDFPNWNI